MGRDTLAAAPNAAVWERVRARGRAGGGGGRARRRGTAGGALCIHIWAAQGRGPLGARPRRSSATFCTATASTPLSCAHLRPKGRGYRARPSFFPPALPAARPSSPSQPPPPKKGPRAAQKTPPHALLTSKLPTPTPQARTVYVVARGNARQGLTAQQRVEKVLANELFAPLRASLGRALVPSRPGSDGGGGGGDDENAAGPHPLLAADREAAALRALRARVAVVEGDLEREALGLCPHNGDLARVLADVTVVLHCAARIALEENIQSTLRANYYGTRELLNLAGRMPGLRAFVHVSTAYVNINRPVFPSTVAERVYRLDMPWLRDEEGDEEREGEDAAKPGRQQQQQQRQRQARGGGGGDPPSLRERAAAAARGADGAPKGRTTRAAAAAAAKTQRQRLQLRPTRSADGPAQAAVPDSPSACSSSSSTSIAGPASSSASGTTAAVRRLASMLWSSGAVGAGRGAAAAARGADEAAAAAAANASGGNVDQPLASRAGWASADDNDDGGEQLEQQQQQRRRSPPSSSAARDRELEEQEDPDALLHDGQHRELAERLMACPDPSEAQELVLGWTRRLGFPSTYCFGKHLAERMVVGWPGFAASPAARLAVVRPSLIHACSGADPEGPPAGFVANFGGPAGFTLSYALGFFQAPAGVAYHGGCVLDAIPVDVVTSMVLAAGAAASAEGRAAAAAAAAGPRAPAAPAPAGMPRPRIYHAASSTSHPLTAASLFRHLERFYAAHPPPVRLPFTRYPLLADAHRPHMPTVALWRGVARLKLRALCWALRWLGREREAKGLERGFRGWEVHNSGKYDRSLAFSTDGARSLAARLDAGERARFTLLWHPSVMSWERFFAGYMAHSYRAVWKRDHATGKKVGGGGAAAAAAAAEEGQRQERRPQQQQPPPQQPPPMHAAPLRAAAAAAQAPAAAAAAARVFVSSPAGGKGAAAARKACASPHEPASAGPVTRSRAVPVA